MNKTTCLMFSCAFLLAACSGGGGGGGTKAENPDPTPTNPVNALRVTIADGADVLVGVADTGVYAGHREFSSNQITATAEFGIDSKPNGHNHGTGVAGVIAGRYTGYSGNAKLAIANIADRNAGITSRSAAAGVGWLAANGAKVINASFSNWVQISTEPGDGQLAGYQAIAPNDAVLVVAAGNGVRVNLSQLHLGRTDPGLNRPRERTGIFGAELPGLAAHTLIVGALNADGVTRWDNSAYPGESPLVQSRFLTTPTYQLAPTAEGSDTYRTFQGTSFAAPVVSAAAASLRSKWAHLTAVETSLILLDTADRTFSPLYADNTCGVTGNVNCGAYYFGQGKLDLGRALTPVGGLAFAESEHVTGQASPVGVSTLRLARSFGDAAGALSGLESAAFDAYGRDFQVSLDGMVRADRLSRHHMGERMHATMQRNFQVGAGERFDSGTGLRVQYDATGALRSARFDRDLGAGVALGLFNVGAGEYRALDAVGTLEGASLMSFDRGDSLAAQMPQISGARLSVPLAGSARIEARHWIGHGVAALSDLDQRTLQRSDIAVQLQPHASTRLSLGAGVQRERGSVLGTQSGGALALGGGVETRMATVGLNVRPSEHTGFFARYEHGAIGAASGGALVQRFGAGAVREFAAGMSIHGSDWLAAAVYSEPQRVSGVKASLDLATGRTLDGQVLRERVTVELTPSGRQRNYELAFVKRIAKHASLHANLLHVREPGHIATAKSETAAMLQFVHRY